MKVRASVKRIDPDRPRRVHPYPADKNPLHPSALRLRDIHVGLEFVIYNVDGPLTLGRILCEPYTLKDKTVSAEFDPPLLLFVDIMTEDGIDTISLADEGVIPWLHVYSRKEIWNQSTCMVRASKAHTLPEPFPLDQGYPSPADIFDIYDGVEYVSPEMPPVSIHDLP